MLTYPAVRRRKLPDIVMWKCCSGTSVISITMEFQNWENLGQHVEKFPITFKTLPKVHKKTKETMNKIIAKLFLQQWIIPQMCLDSTL